MGKRHRFPSKEWKVVFDPPFSLILWRCSLWRIYAVSFLSWSNNFYIFTLACKSYFLFYTYKLVNFFHYNNFLIEKAAEKEISSYYLLKPKYNILKYFLSFDLKKKCNWISPSAYCIFKVLYLGFCPPRSIRIPRRKHHTI